MTLFGLVRHGQTEYNARGLFQGSVDIPLNDTGREQAHAALDHVPDLGWDVVVSSPQSRAEETARIIGADHQIPFGGTESDLREIDWGIAEGKPREEMNALYPDRDFPGREDPQAVADRGYAALERLAERFPGQRVLIVSHGTTTRLLLTGIVQRPLPSIPNGTLSLIDLDADAWEVRMVAGQRLDRPVRVARRRGRCGLEVDPAAVAPDHGSDTPVSSDAHEPLDHVAKEAR
ncbi:MAG: histidine phosphatase family protein [Brachybacterium sp.]|nr:histidine phosphatase family protein [Brachybacterium sp.]